MFIIFSRIFVYCLKVTEFGKLKKLKNLYKIVVLIKFFAFFTIAYLFTFKVNIMALLFILPDSFLNNSYILFKLFTYTLGCTFSWFFGCFIDVVWLILEIVLISFGSLWE